MHGAALKMHGAALKMQNHIVNMEIHYYLSLRWNMLLAIDSVHMISDCFTVKYDVLAM